MSTASPDSPPCSTAGEFYSARLTDCDQRLRNAAAASSRLSVYRGLTSLPAILLAVGNALSPSPQSWPYVVAAMLFLAFLVLVAWHERLEDAATECRLLRRVVSAQRARVARRWQDLAPVSATVTDEHLGLAGDLDLIGNRSILQWLCAAYTPRGQATLGRWLLQPATPVEIEARQLAVRELAALTRWREAFHVRCLSLVDEKRDPEAFLRWCRESPYFAQHPRLKAVVWAMNALMVSGGLLMATGQGEFGLPLVLAVLCANLLINLIWAPSIHRTFNLLVKSRSDVRRYVETFRLLEELPTSVPKLMELRRIVDGDFHVPRRLLHDLERRLRWARQRSSIAAVPYLLLQISFLIDFHVLSHLEPWQRRYASHAQTWFDVLGEIEALASLAAVAHDEPDWCFPEINITSATFRAEQLAHPLLRADQRVANDVEVGPAGTFLLVSGSNMSGKSTLMRSVGVAVVLAQAGAPVCARRCSLPCLKLATSMRIHDSLSDGVSLYFAELMRLKQIVDQARFHSEARDCRVLYLLDEILLGTNSSDRHSAVVRLMAHLLQLNAIGAMTSHDLTLADVPELTSVCRPVHFREEFTTDAAGQPVMRFDYLLRPGIATTTNALKLFELVGLDAKPPGKPGATGERPQRTS